MTKEYSIQELLDIIDGLPETMSIRGLSISSSLIKKPRLHKCKKCTVDGITEYPTRKALVAALGHGSAGARHPNFRYIDVPRGKFGGGRPPKPCTVDGITIYPSKNALVAALGNGNAGASHPNFRYV